MGLLAPLAQLVNIPTLEQTSAQSAILAISPPLRVLPSVQYVVLGRLHQTRAPPYVSCVQLVSTQLLVVLPVCSVETPTSALLGRQSVNPVPPDKRSPPAGPVTKSKTTQQAPARGGKQQTSL
mgnify:CR=1 FL=1